MDHIVPCKEADGSTGYTAPIRIQRLGKIVHSQAETVDREHAAKAWLKRREVELAQPGALEPKPEVNDPPLSDVIDQYNVETAAAVVPTGSNRCGAAFDLRLISPIDSLSTTTGVFMATSLAKIKEQIARLQKQADAIQSGVIARIKKEIARHGLTAEHLFGSGAGGATIGSTPSRAAKLANAPQGKKKLADKPAKFADELGNSWHGVGKRPQWIHAALDAGRTLEEFLVSGRKPAAKSKIPAKAKANAKSRRADKPAAEPAPKKPAAKRKPAAALAKPDRKAPAPAKKAPAKKTSAKKAVARKASAATPEAAQTAAT